MSDIGGSCMLVTGVHMLIYPAALSVSSDIELGLFVLELGGVSIDTPRYSGDVRFRA